MARRRWDTKMVALVAAGVVGLAAAGGLGYVTFRDAGAARADAEPSATAETGVAETGAAETGSGEARTAGTEPATPEPETRLVVSRTGGFSVRVPVGMDLRRRDGSLSVMDADRSLVVSVGPFRAGSLAEATAAFLATTRAEYADVRVQGRRRAQVHDRPAMVSHGRARNGEGVRLRFAVVIVRDRPRNYAISTFTAAGTDPQVVVPKVDAITNSFRVR